MVNDKTVQTFKPFLIQGRENIFRIVEMEEASRGVVERLLEQLPFHFQVRKPGTDPEDLNEPVEVCVTASIIYIYPPKNRVIACTVFDSWRSADVVSRMHVDNVMDTTFPGRGQLRTCVHFDPSILGLGDWPDKSQELEVDIHVYPKGKENEKVIEPPHLASKVLELLELIAGENRRLGLEQLRQWGELVMFAVQQMRACYEDQPEDYEVRQYYDKYWKALDAAKGNPERLSDALAHLASAIQHR